MNYRPDIDGLRALAVVPVVLFHTGVPAFSGGFVGVDVFFVISGFLITTIIAAEIGTGRFSVVTFYERRIRRIFPALFATILVSCLVASYLFMPEEFKDFGQSVVAATLFASNVLFSLEAGYFDAPAELKPLLHTWSLAVEEQFYIVYPLFLMLVLRCARRYWLAPFALVMAASFAYAQWGVTASPQAAFYLAPARGWELLLGACLALLPSGHKPPRWLREACGVAGLALIGWSVLTFSEHTPFPGINALYPCVGAALVIYGGTGGEATARRLLSLRPVVFLGLISYSLYLWHWPVIVFMNYYSIDPVAPGAMALAMGAVVLLAVFSWHFIEGPFRGKRSAVSKRAVFSGAYAVMSVAIAFGVAVHIGNGWPGRLPQEALRLAGFSESHNPRTKDCLVNPEHPAGPEGACGFGPGPERIALWGDSHADAMAPALGRLAASFGKHLTQFTYQSCPPVAGLARLYGEAGNVCTQYNDNVLRYIVGSKTIDTVVLLARWTVYLDGFTRDLGPAERSRSDSVLLSRSEREAMLSTRLQSTVQRLLAAGKKVLLTYPIPETGYFIPSTLARVVMGGGSPASFARPAGNFAERNAFVLRTFDALPAHTRLVRVYPHRSLCDARRCRVYQDGAPLYHDDDHLSLPGAELVARLFEPELR